MERRTPLLYTKYTKEGMIAMSLSNHQVKVVVGNRLEACPSPYCFWENGYDASLSIGSTTVYYSIRKSGNETFCCEIEPVKLHPPKEINFYELDEEVRRKFFYFLNPKGTRQEANLFVYGPVEGTNRNRDIEWAEKHLVYSLDITLQLMRDLGTPVEIVSLIDSISTFNIHRDRQDLYKYLVDNSWIVNILVVQYSFGELAKILSIEESTM